MISIYMISNGARIITVLLEFDFPFESINPAQNRLNDEIDPMVRSRIRGSCLSGEMGHGSQPGWWWPTWAAAGILSILRHLLNQIFFSV